MAVVLYFTMSLDGFVAGPGISRTDPMGIGGEALHGWMFDAKQADDEAAIARQHGNAGAVVLGRRTFDLGLELWGDVPYPADSFVVTHRGRDRLAQKSGTFSFVTTGVASAVEQAKVVAGDREVKVMGAEVARQVLALGLADRLELHTAARRRTALRRTSAEPLPQTATSRSSHKRCPPHLRYRARLASTLRRKRIRAMSNLGPSVRR